MIRNLNASIEKFGTNVTALFISFFEGRMFSRWIVKNIPLAEPCIALGLAFLAGINSLSVNSICCVVRALPMGINFSTRVVDSAATLAYFLFPSREHGTESG
jgi:hypothetical protein